MLLLLLLANTPLSLSPSTQYMDGNVKAKVPGQPLPSVKQPGYPEGWLRRIVAETGRQTGQRPSI